MKNSLGISVLAIALLLTTSIVFASENNPVFVVSLLREEHTPGVETFEQRSGRLSAEREEYAIRARLDANKEMRFTLKLCGASLGGMGAAALITYLASLPARLQC